ncbi:MAG: nicotinate (nicotinamide) nucleotide adenylyltransferase [Clostridia bacterium]|nr:nicotinate (nicotinamide) nucleotide adenylyltransferase [Clostridia bacterium]
MMKVGIFGGTFNPIHKGHIEAAYAFLRCVEPDRLFVIPTKIPPHKAITAHDDPEIRLEMTRRAFAENEEFAGRIEVSDIEIRSEGKSYTYYTLQKLKAMGFDDFYLYCGTDMLLSFDMWFRFEEILSMCTLAYASRLENACPEAAEKIAMLRERYGARIIEIPLDPIEISSSEIRGTIAAGGDASAYLTPAVLEFIGERGLYR